MLSTMKKTTIKHSIKGGLLLYVFSLIFKHLLSGSEWSDSHNELQTRQSTVGQEGSPSHEKRKYHGAGDWNLSFKSGETPRKHP